LLIAGLGWLSGGALSRVDQDLRIMYTEYTLGAADLAHISADVMRYRNTIIRALEAGSRKDFERITESLPGQRARVQLAVDRYAAAEGASRRTSKPSGKAWISTFLRPAPRSTCCPENGMPPHPANGIGYAAMQRNMPQTMPALR
jgi:hypothetical protein